VKNICSVCIFRVLWTSVSTLQWNCQPDPNLPLCINPGWSRIWRMLLLIRVSRMQSSSARELRFLAIVSSWLLGKKITRLNRTILTKLYCYLWRTIIRDALDEKISKVSPELILHFQALTKLLKLKSSVVIKKIVMLIKK